MVDADQPRQKYAAPSEGSDSTISSDGFRVPRTSPTVSIDGYKIIEEISRGGQGTVYKATQLATKRTVAIKVLIEGRFASDMQRQRFEREINLLASLRHPNIVTIFDSGTTQDNQAYLAMEYIRGVPLDQYVGSKKIGEDDTLEVFALICDAVDHAHRHGVIHRDLKPGNVLVDAEGMPHILDFGLAKAAGLPLDPRAPMTETGAFLGTLAYASPEQTLGDPSLLDTRSDVYTLGVMLYKLLTREFPYPVTGPVDFVVRSIRDQPPVKPSSIVPAIEHDVDTILLKALAKDEHQRYQSAGAVASDIDCYLRGEAITARRASLAYIAERKTTSWIVGHPVVTSILALLIAFYAAMGVRMTGLLSGIVDDPFEQLAHQFATEQWSDEVVVASFGDASHRQIDRLAESLDLTGVSAGNVFSIRALHGEWMKRVSAGKPRVVVWNIRFGSTQPEFDARFVEGIEAIHEVGGKVIIGYRNVDLARRPVLSEPIAQRVDGMGWMNLRRDNTGTVVGAMLAEVWPPHAIMPSLSLAAFCAASSGGYAPIYSWDGHRLDVQFTRRSPNNPLLVEASGERHSLLVTEVQQDWSVGLPKGVAAKDRKALYTHTLGPSPDVATARTVQYADVFTMNDEQLRRRFDDKVVVVGDHRVTFSARPALNKLGTHAGVRDEFYGYMHAAAICDLLLGTRVTRLTFWTRQSVFIAAGLLGLLIGWICATRVSRPLYWTICIGAVACIVAALFVVAFSQRQLISPTRVGLSLVIAAWFAAKASTLRRRHDYKTSHSRIRRLSGAQSGSLRGT